jgi:hypothetical protein
MQTTPRMIDVDTVRRKVREASGACTERRRIASLLDGRCCGALGSQTRARFYSQPTTVDSVLFESCGGSTGTGQLDLLAPSGPEFAV